jgi:hypothetical protein
MRQRSLFYLFSLRTAPLHSDVCRSFSGKHRALFSKVRSLEPSH